MHFKRAVAQNKLNLIFIHVFLIPKFSASVDDYKILEEMNKTTSQRYQDMHTVAETISTRLKNLGNKCKLRFEI